MGGRTKREIQLWWSADLKKELNDGYEWQTSSKKSEAEDGRDDKGWENTWWQRTDSLAIDDLHTVTIRKPMTAFSLSFGVCWGWAGLLSLGCGEAEQWDSFPTPSQGFVLISAEPVHTMLCDLAEYMKLSTESSTVESLIVLERNDRQWQIQRDRASNYLDAILSKVYVILNYT